MKRILIFLSLIAGIVGLMLFTSCSKGATVEKAYFDENSHLIIEYSDGTETDMGEIDLPEAEESEPAVTIKNVYVNNQNHAIVEYSDGSTKDLGYVGVEIEVEPPMYTVTFIGANGETLDTQEVYRGKAAQAPIAPTIADKVFSGWDKAFTNVQSDITVQAIYTNASEYTVTFKDELGNTLKTETVISGHSATAPAAPSRTDKIFTGWDKSFNNVTSNLTVTAQYRDKQTYTVTFKDYNGRILGTQSVKEGDSTTAPITPTRDGYNFTGWSSSLSNITSNKTVTAQYSLKSGNNIFDISYVINNNSTVTVTFAIKGTVKFCGLEGSVSVPAGLTYKSLTVGDGVTANYSDGSIIFVYTSNSGTDVTSIATVMTVTFEYTSSFTSAELGVTIADIYDQNYDTVEYSVIGKKITVK